MRCDETGKRQCSSDYGSPVAGWLPAKVMPFRDNPYAPGVAKNGDSR